MKSKSLSKYFFILIVPILLAACGKTDESTSINTDSADIFMEVAEMIRSDETIPDEKWEQLFATEGYRILNWNASRLDDVKKDMFIAFSPKMQIVRDSILAIEPSPQDTTLLNHMMISNFTDMLRHWDELKVFRKTYDFGSIEKNSIATLRAFLHNPVDSIIVFPPVAIVCSDPEARSKPNGIAADLTLCIKTLKAR